MKKKMTKKQKIRLSIIAGVVAIVLLVGAYVFSQSRTTTAEQTSDYQMTTLKKAEPLTFNGSVTASDTQDYSLDATLGKISQVHVTDGQQVEAGAVLLSYESSEYQSQVDEQNNSMSKLNLALANAQENLAAAQAKQSKASQQLNEAVANYNNTNENNSEEDAMKKEQYKGEITQYESALEAANDAVLQAQQMVESSQVDLQAGNQSIANVQAKATSTVTSTTSGIAHVNEKGKTDPSVPVIQVVSSDVTIEGKASEYDYQRLQKDQRVTVKPVTSDEEIEGTITQVDQLPEAAATAAPTQGASTTTVSVANYDFTVKPDKPIQYGYNVQITLPLDEVRLPSNSIVEEDGKQFVYAVKDGKAKKTEVQTEERGSVIIVTSGLKEKDQIVSNPDDKLKDGQELAVN
ncbi:biotin/lipoyl-binding protein [Enterococcus sp. 669A]|uniref:Biotin/lipoyl-binding protein n=1 Tax=Candidatus Enterococcus moelleringii TaxID=2815325 RepID=A0ABS3L8I5_9ENTE|nr:biotin/lipoyl-binding protein [Enterococcus sp. 669A]MBO1305938.1 biotin/lipoyl-binding protein [Enterococcus sp. 669A]